jgi:DNA (cytosine-5)-methyltransferase 1
MRYLSVCSGIEAATVAWHHMGWEAVGYSEIEKFPSQVLAHHYPKVPNLGDMTKFKEWDIGTIDLLVGGTPCQSFSVAGLRKGMADPRGNLALTYCAILDKFKPKWFVWENVPGVLSSGGGRDFGSFLGAVAQLGYGFAYRVLDAQYFGVAQRRKRVFVVGCLGDWRSAAAVLFERESLCGDIKKSRKKKENITTFVESSFGAFREDTTGGTTKASGGVLGGGSETIAVVYENHGTDSRIKPVDVCPTVTSRWGTGGNNVPLVNKTISIQGNLIGRDKGDPQGIGVAENAPMYTLNATDVHGVAQPIVLMDQGGSVMNVMQDGTVGTLRRETHGHEPVVIAPTLTASNDPSRSPQSTEVTNQVAAVYASNMAVRRLTPVECERLQGFPDNYTDIQLKGKPTPDGPRYKALGNSMAVPVMRWIGERINMVEK